MRIFDKANSGLVFEILSILDTEAAPFITIVVSGGTVMLTSRKYEPTSSFTVSHWGCPCQGAEYYMLLAMYIICSNMC
jgi:hypothetical protein